MSLATEALRRLLRRPQRVSVVASVAMLSLGLLVGAGGAWAIVITGSQIQDGSITARDLAAGSVTTSRIASSGVTASDIAVGAVRSSSIATGTVTSDDIALDTVGAADIGSNAVGSEEIANGAVMAADLQAGAVNADSIQDGSVGTLEITDNAVSTSDIRDGTIGSSDIDASLLATLVNSPARAYLPNGSNVAPEWTSTGISGNNSNVVNADVVTYSSINPCSGGRRPIGVHAVLFNAALSGSSAQFTGDALTDPEMNPQPVRWFFQAGSAPRFRVIVTATGVTGNANDVGIVVDCI